jgi:hypothetical protein
MRNNVFYNMLAKRIQMQSDHMMRYNFPTMYFLYNKNQLIVNRNRCMPATIYGIEADSVKTHDYKFILFLIIYVEGLQE